MATINIFGEIGYDVVASDVIQFIQASSDDELDIVIASGGGSAFEGLMIYDALKASGKKVNTKILGLGASAASVIFMAGDTREMGEGSLLMVHNSWSFFVGNKEEIEAQLGTLDAIDSRMTAIFMKATGLPEDQIKQLLSDETFMSADKSIELGFATGSAVVEKVAASLHNLYKNKKKEPLNMAEEKQVEEIDEKDKGLFAKFKTWLKSEEPKAETTEDEEVDDAEKAMEEDEKATFPEEDEKAKAESDDEMEELKAKNAALEDELAELKAKAQSEEETEAENAKAGLILEAMSENKITMAQAKTLSEKSGLEIKAALEEKQVNETGLDLTEEPKSEAKTSHKEVYSSLEGAERNAYFNKHKSEILKGK